MKINESITDSRKSGKVYRWKEKKIETEVEKTRGRGDKEKQIEDRTKRGRETVCERNRER